MKKYGINTISIIGCMLILLSGIFVIPDVYSTKGIAHKIFYTGCFLIIFLLTVISPTIRYHINPKGILPRSRLFPYSKMTMLWSEVQSVLDDNFLCVHFFYIMGKDKATGKKKMVPYTNITHTNHKDFLKEVVSKVPPNTPIDDSILKRIEFSKEDIGKNFTS